MWYIKADSGNVDFSCSIVLDMNNSFSCVFFSKFISHLCKLNRILNDVR